MYMGITATAPPNNTNPTSVIILSIKGYTITVTNNPITIQKHNGVGHPFHIISGICCGACLPTVNNKIAYPRNHRTLTISACL